MKSTPAGRGPADRTRLADALRDARHGTGISGFEAGQRAGMSQSKVSKIERGFLLPSVDDVAALAAVYGIVAELREELVALAAGLRAESSARLILARGVGETQRRIGHLETSASVIRGFQPAMVIGLVQSEDYARCVFDTPDSQQLSDAEVADAVASRAARQRILDDEAKNLVLIMTEGALRWQAGSPGIMASQVDALAQAARRPNVRLGLIPWTTPVQVFPRHGFHLYDEDAVIVATETATATITGAADIATYAELFRDLEAIAVFGDDAIPHFNRIADEYRTLGAASSADSGY